MPTGWFCAVGLGLLMVMPWASASPTSEDYRRCHQQALRIAEVCLEAAPGSKGAACWQRAEAHQQACYREVRADHAPDRKRIEAMRRAEQEARERAAGVPR